MFSALFATFAVLAMTISGKAAANPARRAEHSAQIAIHAPIAQVFPLFTPEGEKQWAQGWHFEPVLPASGDAAQNMVFRTGDDIWILVRYDQQAHGFTYVHTSPDLLARIDVDCRAAGASETLVTVKYMLTSMSDRGEAEVDAFTETAYAAKMAHWQQAINAAATRSHAAR